MSKALRLPNHRDAEVRQQKVKDYLLSPTHPIGKAKAVWFRALGYSQDDWTYLRDDLLNFAKHDAVVLDQTEYGQLYGVSGPLIGPNGNAGQVLTIWIIIVGTANPRLVTAYPDE